MMITLEEFIKVNHGFLCRLATYYSQNYVPGVEFDDLYQVGCLALVDKYGEYNPSKGAISTFSYWVIKDAMLNYVNDNMPLVHVPKELWSLANRMYRKKEQFYLVNDREMTCEEQEQFLRDIDSKNYKKINLVQELNKINLYCNRYMHISLNEEIDSLCDYDGFETDNVMLYKDIVVSDYNLEDDAMSRVSIDEFIDSMSYLKEREKNVFIDYLGLCDDIPKTFMELAQKYGVSGQQLHNDYHHAVEKIKKKMNI